MNPAEIIRKKRDSRSLDPETIGAFINSYIEGDVADYQMSAFLMAAFLNGLDYIEASALTKAYIDSGEKLDWADLPGIPVDKHSTGGVGDKVSLILTPLVAACGAYVPMLSGRGLGHTGGTLDKLESIPGFRTDLSVERLEAQVTEIGCAMGRQTAQLAPADGRIYALRDVTATVESIPLISASIMSKKIAEGAKGLVLDVKVGSGAFMDTVERAVELAEMLIAIGESHGQNVRAVLTDMSEPLGFAVGNALEVEESVMTMRGELAPPGIREITISLAGEMLVLSGICATLREGEILAGKRLDDGFALEKFREMVSAQGGDPRVCDDLGVLPHAKIVLDIPASGEGHVSAIDTRAIGLAALELGAGRKRSNDTIDPSVGFRIAAKLGNYLETGQPLGVVYARTGEDACKAIAAIQSAYSITPEKHEPPRLIIKRLP